MDDKELFREVISRLEKYGISLKGSYVCYQNEPKFNTDGFIFAYNLKRLSDLIYKVIDFR